MSQEKVKEYNAWFLSGLSLNAIGERFVNAKIITSFKYGHESVYEWLEAKTPKDEYDLNISRKHCSGIGVDQEPIHILLMYSGKEPDNSVVDDMAREISGMFGCKVSLGHIDYVQGAQYSYRKTREIRV